MRPGWFRLVAGAILLCPAAPLLAQISVITSPALPSRGTLVRLAVTLLSSDSIVHLEGDVADEPLHFIPADSGRWSALAAIPLEGDDSFTVRLRLRHAAGVVDSVSRLLPAIHSPATLERLSVAPSKVDLDRATQARVDREIALARTVARAAHATPRLWREPFQLPRTARITSGFGTGREYNGKVTSRHLGTDFAGQPGDTVFAANRAVVALVARFYLAGRTIYLDHGAGIVTGYFHLSRALVAVGDTVSCGQPIGLVGQTGRVTGPHLHWSARYGAISFDPMSLLGLQE